MSCNNSNSSLYIPAPIIHTTTTKISINPLTSTSLSNTLSAPAWKQSCSSVSASEFGGDFNFTHFTVSCNNECCADQPSCCPKPVPSCESACNNTKIQTQSSCADVSASVCPSQGSCADSCSSTSTNVNVTNDNGACCAKSSTSTTSCASEPKPKPCATVTSCDIVAAEKQKEVESKPAPNFTPDPNANMLIGAPSQEMCRNFINFAKGASKSNCPALAGTCPGDQLYNPSLAAQAQMNIKNCLLQVSEEEKARQRAEEEEKLANDQDFGSACADFRKSDKGSKFSLIDDDDWICPPMPNKVPALLQPGWLECPPEIKECTYSAPKGVKIKPISKGGIRTDFERNPKCSKCGAKRKPIKKLLVGLNKKSPAVKDRLERCDKPKPEDAAEATTLTRLAGLVNKVSGLILTSFK